MLNLKFLGVVTMLIMALGLTSLSNDDRPGQMRIIMGELTQVDPSDFQGIINDLIYEPAMLGGVSNIPIKRTWTRIDSGEYSERILNKPITDIVFEID
jgi:hypothetical protein